MATINFTSNPQDRRVDIITWTGLGDGDDGSSYVSYLRPDKTVQVTGTFDSTTIVIEGSNDGSNWHTLTDADGGACSFTGAALAFIRESPYYLRPRVTADGGGGDVDVILVAANMGRDW